MNYCINKRHIYQELLARNIEEEENGWIWSWILILKQKTELDKHSDLARDRGGKGQACVNGKSFPLFGNGLTKNIFPWFTHGIEWTAIHSYNLRTYFWQHVNPVILWDPSEENSQSIDRSQRNHSISWRNLMTIISEIHQQWKTRVIFVFNLNSISTVGKPERLASNCVYLSPQTNTCRFHCSCMPFVGAQMKFPLPIPATWGETPESILT